MPLIIYNICPRHPEQFQNTFLTKVFQKSLQWSVYLGPFKSSNSYHQIIIKRMLSSRFNLPNMQQIQIFVPSATQNRKQIKRATLDDKVSDQQSFQPDYHHLKKLGLKPNKKKIQTGGWSAVQNQIYLKFIMDNINDFLTQKTRRSTKVFFRLSKVLKRRTPDQCRSHHQKLQMKYQDDLNGIMQEVLRKIQRTIAEDYVNEQHRLHRPSFICLKQSIKTGIPEQQNQQIQDYNQNKVLNLNQFYDEKNEKKMKIVISIENMQEWSTY